MKTQIKPLHDLDDDDSSDDSSDDFSDDSSNDSSDDPNDYTYTSDDSDLGEFENSD
mgnify:CR=1 FL=1